MNTFQTYSSMLEFVQENNFSLEDIVILQHIENDGIIFMLKHHFYDSKGLLEVNDELLSYIDEKFLTYIS